MRGDSGTLDLELLLGNSQRTLTAAAHELKAPLSLIKMYAARLENSELTVAERKKYNARLLFTAEQMLQLTSGIVESQRWIGGQLPLEPVNTDIICEEVLHELTPAAQELHQNLNFHKPAKAGIAIGHGLMLKNVIFNIVFNALKHTPDGSEISINSVKRSDKTHISVVDTGPGFNKQTIRYVNNGANGKFQAATDRPGSGLGLAVAKQLTGAMNGSLQLKASPKGGYCLVSLQASHQLPLGL